MRIKINMLSDAMALMFLVSSSERSRNMLSWGRANQKEQTKKEITHFLFKNSKPNFERWEKKKCIALPQE